MAAGRRVLVIHDTTELNFPAHKESKRGFGTVGNGVDIGLFLHPQLVVDAVTGGVVGLGCAATASAVLANALEITVVADRESDIYEEFARCPANVHLLTRTAQDRAICEGGCLFAFAAGLAEHAQYRIDVPAKGSRPARKASVSIAVGTVTIKRPKTAFRDLPASVSLRVVDVRETEPPAGEAPIR